MAPSFLARGHAIVSTKGPRDILIGPPATLFRIAPVSGKPVQSAFRVGA